MTSHFLRLGKQPTSTVRRNSKFQIQTGIQRKRFMATEPLVLSISTYLGFARHKSLDGTAVEVCRSIDLEWVVYLR
ncbi:hypothetical protein [Nostoc sp.]